MCRCCDEGEQEQARFEIKASKAIALDTDIEEFAERPTQIGIRARVAQVIEFDLSRERVFCT